MINFSTPLATPLQGMSQASASVDRAASRIASLGTPAGDSVDLSAEMVALIQGKNDFGANVKSAQTMDEMTQTLLNMVG